MHRMIPYFLASLLPLAMLPSNGVAQAPSSADTYVSSSSPKANYGVSPILVVQPGTTTFIQFNLSALPAGASVNKATLRLYVDGVITGGSFDVFPVNGAWSETTLTYNTPPPTLGTSATGNKPIAITTSGFDKFLLIDITPLVQGWVNGTIPNNGLALALTSTAGFFSFDAKESVLTGNGPELEIVLNGPAGPQGIQGIPGPAGPNGPQGAQGPQGPAGPQGSAGAAGPQGPQGPQGMKGDTGATGPQGIPGAQGAPGPQGPMGVDGAAGATGPQGPIGPAGLTPQGAWNSTSPYVLNDAVTESGQTWRCKVTDCVAGSDPSAVGNTDWELLAAKGADGAQGPQGAQGLKGDTGAAGVQGAPGPAGPQGPAGATGPAGPMGLSITGPQGPQGPPGRQGDAGPAGAAGPAGLQWLGPWQSGVAYLPNQAVSYNGSSYLAVTGNQAFPPSTIGPWQLLASMGATGLAAPPLPPPDCPNPLTVTISVFSSPSLVGSPVTLLGAFANPNVTQSNPTECLKPATYSWKLNASPPGSVAGFNDLSSPSLSFVPDVPGMYQVMLTVTTTDFQTGSGYLTVFATGCGTYPLNPGVMVVSGNGVVATSSTPLSPSSLGHFKVGTALSFDGTLDLTGAVLVDPNAACSHGSLAYNWSIYALPAGSQAAIYPATAAKPTMTLDAVGTYVLKFILSDSYTSSTVYLSVDAQ